MAGALYVALVKRCLPSTKTGFETAKLLIGSIEDEVRRVDDNGTITVWFSQYNVLLPSAPAVSSPPVLASLKRENRILGLILPFITFIFAAVRVQSGDNGCDVCMGRYLVRSPVPFFRQISLPVILLVICLVCGEKQKGGRSSWIK